MKNVHSAMLAEVRHKSAYASEQFDQSLLSSWRHFTFLAIQNAHSKDSDQTAQIRSLIWIFAGAYVRWHVFYNALRLYCIRTQQHQLWQWNMTAIKSPIKLIIPAISTEVSESAKCQMLIVETFDSRNRLHSCALGDQNLRYPHMANPDFLRISCKFNFPHNSKMHRARKKTLFYIRSTKAEVFCFIRIDWSEPSLP